MRAGQEILTQRRATVPCWRMIMLPQLGQTEGILNGNSSPLLYSVNDFTTLGITSPAR